MSILVLRRHGEWLNTGLTAGTVTWDLHDGLSANLNVNADTTLGFSNLLPGVPLWLRVTGDDTSELTVTNAIGLDGNPFTWIGDSALVQLFVQDATTIFAAVAEETGKSLTIAKAGHGLAVGDPVNYATDLSDVLSTNANENQYNGVVSEVIDAGNVRVIPPFGGEFVWVGHGLTDQPYKFLSTTGTWVDANEGSFPMIGLLKTGANTFCPVAIPGIDQNDGLVTISGALPVGAQVGDAVDYAIDGTSAALTDSDSNTYNGVVATTTPFQVKPTNTGPMTWTGHGFTQPFLFLGEAANNGDWQLASEGSFPMIGLQVVDPNTVIPITVPHAP